MDHERNDTSSASSMDIAIIGMGCMFPGAPNLAAFWQNIVEKVDAITDPPPEAWNSDLFYDPRSAENDRVYCKRGGYLGPQAYFNPLQHGIMPRALDGGEPDQWLALQVAYDALADAGYPNGPQERQQTAVILGKGTYINRGNLSMVQHSLMVDQTLQALKTLQPELSDDQLQLIRQDLKRQLPAFNSETASAMVPNIVAGRIANRLDLMGPSYTVDAACASSLVALDMAVRGLRSRDYDLALAGGVQVTTPIPILTLFSQLKALSLGEEIRPFDKDADGTILSEGLGIVVLKRLEDAQRDSDRIYAVVKGVGVASDGRGLSVLAPRVEGEELALRRAYTQAGISPRSVGLIEAHGTATLVGDAAEIEALANIFGRRDSTLPSCALGTVKSMIGHTMPAAGIAGVIKGALALYQKTLPPTLHVEQPSPRLQLEKTPFYINTESRPWIHGSDASPRRAGVNAFGFGGINAHAILEEYSVADETATPSQYMQWDTEVCILEGTSREEVVALGRRLQRFLQAAPNAVLKDVAYTLNTGRSAHPGVALAIVASSTEDLRKKLEQTLNRLADPAQRTIKARSGIYFFDEPLARAGKLAFLFPGEGAQYVNMLADLCMHFPEVRKCFDAVDRVYAGHARGYVPSDFIFPRPVFSEEEKHHAAEGRIWQMDVAIEALLTANHALYMLLDRLEIRPDVIVGHSTGEYSAMRAAGMLGDETSFARRLLDLNRLYEGVAHRDGIPKAKLVAVGADRPQVDALIADLGVELFAAMDNCSHQVVLVGATDAIDRAVERLQHQGLVYEVLAFDRPYHTPLFAPYAGVLREFLSGWITERPRVPLYSCTTGTLFPADLDEVRRIAFEHWCRPVEFRKTVEAMYADDVRVFVEVGPRGNLTTFVDDILRGRSYAAIPANVQRRSGTTQLNHLVGLLAVHGAHMRLDPLYERRAPRRLDLDRPSENMDSAAGKPGRVKLPTGWPPMEISIETAAEIQKQLRGSNVPGRSDLGDPAHATSAPASRSIPRDSTLMAPSPEIAMPRQGGLARNAVAPPAPATTADPMSARPGTVDQVVSEYLHTMEEFLTLQQEVMQAYLAHPGAPTTPIAASQSVATPIADAWATETQAPSIQVRIEGAVTGGQVGVDHGSSAREIKTSENARQVLLRLVGERTGYPADMLDLSLDLEGDLGVDSIKRVEILGAFQRETGLCPPGHMDRLTACRSLQAMLDVLAEHERDRFSPPDSAQTSILAETSSPPVTTGETASTTPGGVEPRFVHTVLTLIPGECADALCEISLEAHPFLLHHTLGREVSQLDTHAVGLAVVPFTMSMEIMAEVASLLMPGKVVVGMQDLRAYRWMPLDGQHLTLHVSAACQPSESRRQVRVQMYESGSEQSHEAKTQPLVEGTIVFDDTYSDQPWAGVLSLQNARPSHWPPERLYRDGMFHGPAFRGVVSMERWGEDGAEALLEVLPRNGLFRANTDPALLTDPILLDQPGQVLAFWMAEHLDRGFVILPFHLASLRLYGPPLPVGERPTCRIRVTLLDDLHVRADLEIVRPDGHLWARLEGWEDRRFDMPPAFFRFLLAPRETVVSERWAAPAVVLPGSDPAVAYRVALAGFPPGFFTAYGGIWQRVLARLILSRRERELWDALRTPMPRRLEWLLGRLAGKDAVRELVREQQNLTLCPADIEILPDEHGRPVVSGNWIDRVPRVPALSLAHTAGIAAALASDIGESTGIGVDIELVGRMNDDVAKVAFTRQEEMLLATLGAPDGEVWPVRFWCAKEAVAKAVGLGMIGGPQALVVEAVDTERGSIRVRLPEELARRLGQSEGVMTAFTVQEGDLIIASALCAAEGREERACGEAVTKF